MPEDVSEAIARLWSKIPVGSGKDFNTVLKHIEKLQRQLDSD